jgi:hypothetical protein
MKQYRVVCGPVMHIIEAEFAEVIDGNRLFFMEKVGNAYEPVAAFDDGAWDYFVSGKITSGSE